MKKELLLKIQGISKKFPGVKALDQVSFEVEPGEVHAIVGENGAGKSTLMNILSGVYTPDEGKIIYQGQDTQFKDPRHAQELGVAMIHQELSLATNLSVMENIFIGRLKKNRFGFVDNKKMLQSCTAEFQAIGIRDIDPNQLIKELSVSQMQLVEIVKALSIKSKLMIMDEPTSSLTKQETEILFKIIRDLKANGVSILYISHRMEEIFEITDRITVLRDGKYIKTLQTKETNVKEIVSLMVGRDFNKNITRNYKAVSKEDQPILEVRNLSSGNKVDDVSFKLYKGEILAITGLVGAGRTELLQAIFGINKVDSGEVLLDGKQEIIKSTTKAIKLGLGLVPEGRKTQGLFYKMSVRENITMVNLPALTRWGMIAKKKELNFAASYIAKLRVKTPGMEQQVQFLSGGNQQKTIIARWLLNNPKILFLDEPTHGVDIGAKSEIYEIINQLADAGVSVVLISSELPEVLTLADRILVMCNGKVNGEIGWQEANQELIMQYATNQMECCNTEKCS
ncbi:MAG: sugar ABC transporter ATP-binding protein [Bacillota bacterium]|nr:sugar ABC transporter ATP-binding protein [Bacillota bacterium]